MVEAYVPNCRQQQTAFADYTEESDPHRPQTILTNHYLSHTIQGQTRQSLI